MPRSLAIQERNDRPALIASAVRYPGNSVKVYQGQQEWQKEAWRFYDITGELRFAANWMANVLSRANLTAAIRDINGNVTEPGTAKGMAAMAALFAGSEGQASMLSALGLHLTVAGEAYVIGRAMPAAEGKPATEKWEVVGVQEIRNTGSSWSINYGNSQKNVDLTADDVVIRIWRPHPRNRIEADSPVRALLPILTELEYLTRHVFAQVTSRLAGAGILVLPQGMSFPPAAAPNPALADGKVVAANTADEFMQVLAEAMLTPIKEPGNASALVPIVVTVPDDLVDKANLIHFWSDLDQNAIEMRNEAIRRFALGMDMPPEVLLGLATSGSSANHWTSWQIEESAIKVNIEPLLQLICDALRDGYLIPATANVLDTIAYDTSAIRLRPDRSKEAFELYDRGVIDAAALRRENGFDEDDTPNDLEYRNWLLRKVASGSAAPEQVAAALGQLGIRVPGGDTPTNEARPTPSLNGHPTRELPDSQDQPVRAALIAASEVLVFRALERAGNRLRSQTGQRPSCSAAETYRHTKPDKPVSMDWLMADAWECIPQLTNSLDVDPVLLTAHLDAYTRHLLKTSTPHSREQLAAYLNTVQ